MIRMKIQQHLRKNITCQNARESRRAAAPDQQESFLGQLQGCLRDASSTFCNAFDCGGDSGGFLGEEEEEDSNLGYNANGHQNAPQPTEAPKMVDATTTTLEDVVEGDASAEDIMAFSLNKMIMEQEEERASNIAY